MSNLRGILIIAAVLIATIVPHNSLRLCYSCNPITNPLTGGSSTAVASLWTNKHSVYCGIGGISIHKAVRRRRFSSSLHAVEIKEFADDDFSEVEVEPIKTHGYEGDFKVGDLVRVKSSIRIWSVKPYTKTGFDALGFVGTVHSLALFGRKYKTLCSAITPIKVEFQPDGDGIPSAMFEKKWIGHFSSDELDLIRAAATASVEPT